MIWDFIDSLILCMAPFAGFMVKFSLEQATKAQRGVEVELYSFVTSELDGGGGSKPRPGCFTPGNNSVPIVQEAG